MMSEKEEDFKMIRTLKKTTVRSVSFPHDIDAYLETVKSNASAFLTKLVREHMEKQKVKKELEREKFDLEGYPLTEDEIRLAAKLYVDFWRKENLRWSDKKLPTNRYFTPDDLYNWQDAFREAERLDLWQTFKEAVEKISEDDFLRPLKKAAEVLWQEKWRERYDKVVVADLTLEQICRIIDKNAERSVMGVMKNMTIKDVAQLLHLNYQQVHKITPLLEEEFGSFIKYRTKEN